MSFEKIEMPEVQTNQIKIKRTSVTSEIRKRIISLALEGKGNGFIANLLGLPRTTVVTIVSKFYNKGEDDVKKRGGNHRGKLTSEQKEHICRKVDENCFLSLNELVLNVYEQFGISVSKSTIDRCLQEFHYTIKNVLPVPIARNCERTIDLRYVYAQEFRRLEQTIPLESFLFLDEVGFKVCTRAKKGRSKIGITATASVPQTRSRNISVVAVMNRNELLYFKIHDRAVNGDAFQICLDELKEKCQLSNIVSPVLILDNARIHHYRNLNFEGYNVLYLPPYCPFLNPIENCFSKWKNIVSRNNCLNEAQLKIKISSAFFDISPSDCNGYYRNMLKYLNMSNNKENIDC